MIFLWNALEIISWRRNLFIICSENTKPLIWSLFVKFLTASSLVLWSTFSFFNRHPPVFPLNRRSHPHYLRSSLILYFSELLLKCILLFPVNEPNSNYSFYVGMYVNVREWIYYTLYVYICVYYLCLAFVPLCFYVCHTSLCVSKAGDEVFVSLQVSYSTKEL